MIFQIISIILYIAIVITVVFVWLSKITTRRKLIWTFIVIMFSFPQIWYSRETGSYSIHLLSFGVGYGSVTYLPVGGVIFWLKRKGLIRDSEFEAEIKKSNPFK
jgi:hypothetical protein